MLLGEGWHAILSTVSMESGLEDRNNARQEIVSGLSQGSQWSPA